MIACVRNSDGFIIFIGYIHIFYNNGQNNVSATSMKPVDQYDIYIICGVRDWVCGVVRVNI